MTRRIAVIGSGASGSLVATRLLERLGPKDNVWLIGDLESSARGVAYSTDDLEHRLNVRAQNMSAYPDEPDHFVRWLVSIGAGDEELLTQSFMPRPVYGDYLEWCLRQAIGRRSSGFERVVGKVASMVADGDRVMVGLDDGGGLRATHVVLATGHLGPRVPPSLDGIASHPRFVGSPWISWRSADLAEKDVLIVGTGLTMVDVVMSIRKRNGSGRIFARSRRGLEPHPHRRGPKPPALVLAEDPETIRGLAREVICRSRTAGDGWRSVIDACRPHTCNWWAGLSWDERRRFLRRLQPYWDTHRHRVPDEIYAVLKQMRIEGKLDIAAGQIHTAWPSGDGFEVGLRHGSTQETLRVDWVVNCTGPDTNYRDAKVPVLESAVGNGLAQYDPLGMGLLVKKDHSTDDRSRVFAIGPLCRGSLWETIAMPEIRVQAQLIAERCSG